MRQRGGAERAKTVRMFFWKRGVLAAAMAALILSGCSEYESSEELRAQAGTEAQADGEVQAAAEVRTSKQTETGADISGRSQSRTRAAVPEFETVSDRVYVNTEGGSVRIRSAGGSLSEPDGREKEPYHLRQCRSWYQRRRFCKDSVSSRRQPQGHRRHYGSGSCDSRGGIRRHDL